MLTIDDVYFQTNWTPCHMAVHSGSIDCLDLLLTFTTSQSECLDTVRREVTTLTDKDGWMLVHLAASLESPVRLISRKIM